MPKKAKADDEPEAKETPYEPEYGETATGAKYLKGPASPLHLHDEPENPPQETPDAE